MRIKALISFVGAVDMNIGEVREISDEKLASSLISCGYAERIENTGGDVDADIGNNSRRRKKGAEN